MSYFPSLSYGDSPNLDAFARLRVSNPQTLFDSKQIFNKQGLFWDESLESGSGTTSSYDGSRSSSTISSSLNTASKFTRQTYQRFNYQPGKSQLILMTGVLDKSGGGTGVQRRIGYFDDDDGLFFEDDEGTVKVVRRTSTSGSPVDNKTAQSSWNIDPMDGTGPSGVTIDWTKTQIFGIDFEWLGVGRVRFFLVIDGVPYPVHQELNTNVLDVIYMVTPNLPLRYQMVTTASSPASELECICSSVMSEGGVQDTGIVHWQSTDGTHVDATTENTLYAIVGLRLKSTELAATVNIEKVALTLLTNSHECEWKLIFNPTIDGAPSWSSSSNRSVEWFLGATANTVSDGTPITGGYLGTGTAASASGGTSEPIANALRLGSEIDGTQQTIVLCVQPINGSSAIDVEGGISWRELS